MPDVKVWIDTATDDDYNVANNWSPAGVPGDGDTLIFNDQALGPMTDNIDAATVGPKAFDVIVDRTFQHYIGASGDAFSTTGSGASICFGTLIFSGSGLTPSYFDANTGDTCTRVVLDTQSASVDVLVLGGAGSWGDFTLRNGKGKFAATTVTGRIQMLGGSTNASSVLNIPAGNTLSGTRTGIVSGRLVCGSAIPDVNVSGGEFVLDGTVGIGTRLEMYGGTTFWDASASSTIVLADIFGGTFTIRKDRIGRTLTNMGVYGSGIVDFSTGGHNVTFSNAPRIYGTNPMKMPQGMSVVHAI